MASARALHEIRPNKVKKKFAAGTYVASPLAKVIDGEADKRDWE